MSHLQHISECLIIAIQTTLEAWSIHFEKQGQCKNF